MFAPLQKCRSLRLLHIRPLGWIGFKDYREGFYDDSAGQFAVALDDVHQFANWAFGPDGLLGLRVLSFGDFSYQGRRPNISFCRYKPSCLHKACELTSRVSTQVYKRVTRDDVAEQEILRNNANFLQACPEDSLLYEAGHPF